MPKDISDIEATEREEMVCPHCGRQTLKAHPIADEKSSKKAKIVYGTTCGNPQCPKNGDLVNSDEISEQYAGGGFSVKGGMKALVVVGLLIATIGIMAQAIGIVNFGGPSTYEVTGQVSGPDGKAVQGATVVIGDTKVQTNSTGAFTAKVPKGSHSAYVLPPNSSSYGATSIYKVTVKGTDQISFNNAKKSSANFQLTTAKKFSASGTSARASFNLNLSNAGNGGLTRVKVVGSADRQVESERTVPIKSGSTKTITVNGSAREQNYVVTTPVQTSKETKQLTYTDPLSFQIEGNQQPRNVKITLDSQASSTQESVRGRVDGTKKFNIDINSDQPQQVTAVLSQGTSSKSETKQGTYTGTNPSLSISKNTAPATVDVALTGNVKTQAQSTTGTASSNTLKFNVEGNLPATNAKITFKGGEATRTQVASESLRASGKNGRQYKEIELVTTNSGGTYILDSSYNIEKGSSYVQAGYMVNGDKIKLSEGTTNKEIQLNEGDTLSLWIEATAETTGSSKSFSGDGSNIVDVVDYRVEPTEPSVGESVYVYATLKNTGSQADDANAYLYIDGLQKVSQNVAVKAGETKEVRLATLNFNEKSVHTVSVNDLDPTLVKVGGATVKYGVGSISADLYKQAGNGQVSVDTDGDNKMDCTVSATGGTCNLGQMSPGSASVKIEQQGVSNVQYEVSYTKRIGAKNVKLDVNNDGSYEATHSGLLAEGETMSGSAELQSGLHNIAIDMSSGQQSGVGYKIQWAKSGVINSPTIIVDGKTVVDSSESYQGEKQFDLGRLSPGEHTVTFKSSGGAYTAEVQWKEAPEKSYPPISVNGEQVCSSSRLAENGGTCSVPNGVVTKGSNTLSVSSKYAGKGVTISYTKRNVPSKVRITVQSSSGSNSYTVSADQGTIKSGTWRYKSSEAILAEGDNTIEVVSQAPTGAKSIPATVKVSYTSTFSGPAQPRLVVINSRGEKNSMQVPKEALTDSGVLDGSYTFEPPATWFTEGKNTVKIVTQNGVPVEITVTGKSANEQNIQISSSGNQTNSSDN